MSEHDHLNYIPDLYADDSALAARLDIHDRYTIPAVNVMAWALSFIEWRGDERVLDVGCGPGRWYSDLLQYCPNATYIGIDLFPRMVTAHPNRDAVAVGDGQALPFPDHSFDVVMVNFVMYHLPDFDSAVREFRRVLKPGGQLMVTSNSMYNMPELQELIRRAVGLLMPFGADVVQVPEPSSERYTIEYGTRHLSRYFYAIVRHDLPTALVFPDSQPLLDYLESIRGARAPQLPLGVSWDDVMIIVREQVERLIDHFGEIAISKLSGLLIATDDGGFIREYLEYTQAN